MQVLQASGAANSLSQTLAHTPIAGDVLWFLHLHNREPTPRNVTSMTGAGATWTRENTPGGQRFVVYKGEGATTTGTVQITFDGSLTGGCMLIHLRPDLGEDLTVLTASVLEENIAGGTSQVGPLQSAHRGQLVAALCLGGNPATLDHATSTGLYTPLLLGSSSFMDGSVAMPFNPLGEDVAHQITMNCAASGYVGVAQVVIGDADGGPFPLRFYPTSSAAQLPGATPAFDSLWDVTGSANQLLLTLIPVLSILGDTNRNESVTGPVDVLTRQSTSWPIFPAMTLAGSWRMVMQAFEGNADMGAFLNAVVRACDDPGTTFRGTIYPGQGTHASSPTPGDPNYEFNAGTRGTRILSGNIAPLAIQERDRIVLDFGYSCDNPTAVLRTTTWRLGDPAVDDLPYTVDDVSTTQRPWFELNLIDPPTEPLSVACSADASSITLTWAAPDGFTPADSYEVRIDGGPPIDAGNVLTYTFDGLASGTEYTVEVRAVNAAGESAWVTCTTDTPSPECDDCQPRWLFESCDLRTGRVRSVLDPIACDFQTSLNGIGQGSMTLATRDVRVRDIWPDLSLIACSSIVDDPNNPEGLWLGIVDQFEASSAPEGGTTRVGLVGIESYLTRRVVREFLEFIRVGQTKIAADVVNYVSGGVGGGIPLTATFEASAYQRIRRYRPWDRQTIWDIVEALTQIINGLDWEMTYTKSAGAWSAVMIFRDVVGEDRNQILQSDVEGAAYTLVVDAAGHATWVDAIGEGEEEDMLIATARDTAGIYPQFDAVTTYKEVSEIDTLQEHADGDLERMKEPAAVPSITVPGHTPPPSLLKLGDTVEVHLDHGAVTYHGDARIIDITWAMAAEQPDTRTFNLEPLTRASESVLNAEPTDQCEDCP